MDTRKKLAIEAAGIKMRFPYSPHEPTREQKFDAMWPDLQAKYYRQADAMLKTLSEK